MNTKLNHIQNWPELAKHANWSVAKLARQCKVSPRTLERHFKKAMNKSPKTWISDQRQKRAFELLYYGSSVKETALNLGYKHSTNFSRKFKSHWGICPVAEILQIQDALDAGCRKMIEDVVK